ncbi:hypothetical protein ES708_32598 [subsurface metagenome]
MEFIPPQVIGAYGVVDNEATRPVYMETFEAHPVEDEQRLGIVGFIEPEEIKCNNELERVWRLGLKEVNRIFKLPRWIG